MAKLIIRTPDGQEREFPLADRPLRIGRGEHNDVVLPDPEKAVSRFHAELRFEDGGYRLVDANTPNGLWVAGERVPEVVLAPGVAVVVGPYTLSLDDASQPPKTVAVPVMAPTMLATAPRVVTPPEPTPTPRRAEPPKSVVTSAEKRPSTATKTKTKPRPALSTTAIGAAGVALAVILAIVIAVVLGRHRRAAQQVAKTDIVATPAPAPVAAPVAAEPTNEEKVRDHLEQAQRLFDAKDYDGATNELAQVTELDASNGDAAQLHAKIDEARRPAPPVSAPTKKDASASRGAPPIDPKAKGLQDRLEQAKAALSADPQNAIRILEGLMREDPPYQPAAPILEQARARVRDDIQARLTAAKKLETADELVPALLQYIEAQKLGAADLDDQNRVRDKLQKEGDDAFKTGRQYYAVGQLDKALPFYERAAVYLRDGDPNRKIAKDRVDEIRAKLKTSQNG